MSRFPSARSCGVAIVVPCLALAGLAAPAAAQLQFVDQTATRFPQPGPLEYTNQVAIEDVDADGDLDVVWANGGGYSSVLPPQVIRFYMNSGLGVFTDETVARTGGTTAVARDVEFGDVDGDGDADMVVATDFLTQPRLFINTGSGFFADQTAARLPAIPLGSPHVTLGDVDNDGDLDLCFAHGSPNRFGTGPTQLWMNNGAGVFTDQSAARLPASPCAQPMDASFADVDGDLDLDVLIGSRAGSGSKLFINNGAGTFSNASPTLPPTSTCYSFDFGDYDNDNDLDLLGVNTLPGSSRDTIWRNNGAGLYTDVTATALPVASNPAVDDNDSKFLDADNDGDLDFIIASLGSTERYCRNNGDGTFTLIAGAITAVQDSSLDNEVGDLDGDGDLDMVTAQGESGSFLNRIYINTTGPADTRAPKIVQTEQAPPTTSTTGPYVVRAVIRDDMTGDRNFFASALALRYTVSGVPGVQSAPLRWAGHDVYRGSIPGQACGSTIEYWVDATDKAGNNAQGPHRTLTISPYADCNNSGTLTVADFGCFQGKYVLGDLYADCNNSGTLTVADFGCFQGKYVLGCP
ncbi:MAG: FG-GAP-like repeat-containing protein [Phycisphaerales bacterium]